MPERLKPHRISEPKTEKEFELFYRYKFNSNYAIGGEFSGVLGLERPDIKRLAKAMRYFWEISVKRIGKTYKVDKFPSTAEDIKEKLKEGRIPIFVPHEINLIDLGRIFTFLDSKSKYLAEGSPVVDNVNNFGWLWIERSITTPNKGASPKELEEMFRMQGRQGQSLRTYIIGGLMHKFFELGYFDAGVPSIGLGKTTKSILLGSSVEGRVLHAGFSMFSAYQVLHVSTGTLGYTSDIHTPDVGGRSEEVILPPHSKTRLAGLLR